MPSLKNWIPDDGGMISSLKESTFIKFTRPEVSDACRNRKFLPWTSSDLLTVVPEVSRQIRIQQDVNVSGSLFIRN